MRKEKCKQGPAMNTLKKETTWKFQAVDRRIILKCIFKKTMGYWIHQNRNQWWTVVNKVLPCILSHRERVLNEQCSTKVS
jgi:hypothetical protein